MNDIRNWSSLAAIKHFTIRKHNTVDWPKMHNFENGLYKFFRGYTSVSLYFVHAALRLGIPSPPIEIYVTIVLGDICVGKLHLTLPRNNPDGMGEYTQLTWKIINLPLNVSQKFTLKNAKPILLKTTFSLFYINALTMSSSFTELISSLHMLLASWLSRINK